MPNVDTAILGGGLAGLSAGYFLARSIKGKDYLIFEKENQAGGLCRSKSVNGFIFDCDGHLLHFRDRNTYQFVKGLLGDNLISHERNSWIQYKNYNIPYPFQNFFLRSPGRIAEVCFNDFVDTNGFNGKISNFRDWCMLKFGRGIYRNFMFPYNSKFWAVNPSRLTCDWLDGFIPIPKLNNILDAAGGKNGKHIGYNSCFWYPRYGGIQSLVSAINMQNKGRLCLSYEATEIDLEARIIRFKNNKEVKFKRLVSSIPLPELLNLIPRLPVKVKSALKKLNYNSIFVLNLGIDRPNLCDKHWIYFPDKETIFYRVGFFSNFSSFVALSGKSSLYAEVSYSRNTSIDKKALKERIIRDLIKVNILNKDDEISAEDMVDIRYGYPIYDLNCKTSRKIVLDFLKSHNIIPIGRYGKWKYMSMEDVILDAKNTVSLLLK